MFFWRRPLLAAALAAGMVVASTSASVSQTAICNPVPKLNDKRSIQAEDLLKIRDIGGLVSSPDGRRLAFHVRQARLEKNDYVSGWCILDLVGGSDVELMADGGDPIWETLPDGRVLAQWAPVGHWSPDGKHFAFIKRQNGQDQIWIVSMEKRRAIPWTNGNGDVKNFVFSSSGDLIYQTGPDRAALSKARLDEANSGYHFDGRMDPLYSLTPLVSDRNSFGVEPEQYFTASALTRAPRPASREEKNIFNWQLSFTAGLQGLGPALGVRLDGHPLARSVAVGGDQHIAWVEPANSEEAGFRAARTLLLSSEWKGKQKLQECRASGCRGVFKFVWVSENSDEILFVKTDPDAFKGSVLLRWDTRTDQVQQIARIPEKIDHCVLALGEVVCSITDSLSPPRLVAIAIRDGVRRVLLDLNPEFRSIKLSPAELVHAPGRLQGEALGYLVKPPEEASVLPPYPLVIVQYRADGFLRGGAGDEYPIQLMAAHGLAVFVFERPDDPVGRTVSDPVELTKRQYKGMIQRKRIQAALESALDVLQARGDIDMTKVGISGLSDGSDTTQYVLNHSKRFRVASVSDLGWSPIRYFLEAEWIKDVDRQRGFGRLDRSEGENWREMSVGLNADHIKAPILVQAADREFLANLENLTLLKDSGVPFDAYVFPDEYHTKWQPKHRAAIYQRNLDWFRFWLTGNEDSDPGKAQQYLRWREMREGYTKRAER